MSPDVFSRRGWLVRIGGAAVLRGIAGSDLDAAENPPLPPGLYQPSLQHLAHILKPAIAPAAVPIAPQYYSGNEFAMVETLVARILGEETSAPIVSEIAAWLDLIVGRSEEVRAAARALSPEHRHLAVDYYGEETVRELETEDPQPICRQGLAALDRAGFSALDATAQLAHLTNLENANDSFMNWIKRRTLDGFYTSRQGLQELDYKGNAFYAECPGCDHQNGHS